MKEKDLEQKVDDAIKLFEMCQKQVADLNVKCNSMMDVCMEMKASMEGVFSVHDSKMDVREKDCIKSCSDMQKRMDEDKRKQIDADHLKDLHIQQDFSALKACFLNMYEFLPTVRSVPPSQKEKEDLHDQLNNLGM